MRLLVKLAVMLAVVWCAWWAIASYGVSRGITAWVTARQADGLEVDVTSSQGGFPFNIATNVDAFDLANPATGNGVQAAGIKINAATYWPGRVNIDLPDTPITFRGPTDETAVIAQDATIAVRLRAGLALEMRSVHVGSANWTLQSRNKDLLTGKGLTLMADQTAVGSAQYDVSLNADALALGTATRQILVLPPSLPEAFQTFTANGSVTFDAPISRTSKDDNKPQFRQIILDGAQIDWGSIALRAMGAVDVDATGVPSGTVTVQAKDWRNLLDLAQAAGMLPAERRGQMELMFSLVAGRSGSADDLDLDLTFENGRMVISGIPLGPAPRLIIQ